MNKRIVRACCWILGVGVGGGVTLGALFNLPGLGGLAAIYVVGSLAAALAHAYAAALVVVNPIVRRRGAASPRLRQLRQRTLFQHPIVGFIFGIILSLALVYLDWLIVHWGPGVDALSLYFVSAAFGIGLIFYPHEWLPGGLGQVWARPADYILDIGGGLVAAVFAVVALIGISAHIRQARAPDVAFPLLSAPRIHGSYVSLGDSYPAGEGLAKFEPSTVTNCHRSLTQSFGDLLEAAFARSKSEYVTTSLKACSGAVVANILHQHMNGGVEVPPQVSGKPDPTVGLVTLMVGGDNLDFSRIVVSCFEHSDCRSAPFSFPDSTDPVLRLPRPLKEQAVIAIKDLATSEGTLYALLRRHFPSARIIVIGYPYLFPGGSPTDVPNDCATVTRRVSKDERQWFRDRTDDLNNMLYAETAIHGLEYLSPTDAWKGHEPCGSAGQFTNSLKPLLHFGNPIDGGSFHPNADGQQEFASLIVRYLHDNPVPPNAFSSGHSHAISLGNDYCPSTLGLKTPPLQSKNYCPQQ